MVEDELRTLVTGALDRKDDAAPWSGRSGAVLYSDLDSIRPGPVYLMGINPGGKDDKKPTSAITRRVAAPHDVNSYADECWTCHDNTLACRHCENGRLLPEHRSSFQQRVCNLFKMLGAEPKNVLSTNLIFGRSPSLRQLPEAAKWNARCRPVHLTLLDIVRPNWIVMLGFGQAFHWLGAYGREVRKQEAIKSGGRDVAWHKQLEIPLGTTSLPVGVLGVVHPGRLGFQGAGLRGNAYPDAIQQFIAEHVLPR